MYSYKDLFEYKLIYDFIQLFCYIYCTETTLEVRLFLNFHVYLNILLKIYTNKDIIYIYIYIYIYTYIYTNTHAQKTNNNKTHTNWQAQSVSHYDIAFRYYYY